MGVLKHGRENAFRIRAPLIERESQDQGGQVKTPIEAARRTPVIQAVASDHGFARAFARLHAWKTMALLPASRADAGAFISNLPTPAGQRGASGDVPNRVAWR